MLGTIVGLKDGVYVGIVLGDLLGTKVCKIGLNVG